MWMGVETEKTVVVCKRGRRGQMEQKEEGGQRGEEEGTRSYKQEEAMLAKLLALLEK
jgi:hypothetical protein